MSKLPFVDHDIPQLFVSSCWSMTARIRDRWKYGLISYRAGAWHYRIFPDSLKRSALYSTHQNHIDREGLRLNFGHLVTCYTSERCVRCFSGIRLSFALSLITFGRSRSHQQKGEYNEYSCILANIVHEVLKHVSVISWGYVIHI